MERPQGREIRKAFRGALRAGAMETCEETRLTLEQSRNNVRSLFSEGSMVRAVVEEAAALASVSLFVGMIAIWAQFFAAL